MKKAILYIHGKGGSYLEAEAYKKIVRASILSEWTTRIIFLGAWKTN